MASNPIDMPANPSTGTIFDPGNNVQYEWDGEKWVSFTTPGEAQNYWFKDNQNNFLRPIEFGEDLVLRDLSNNTTVTLTSSSGNITATSGDLFMNATNIKSMSVRTNVTDSATEMASIDSAGLLTCKNIDMANFPLLP